MGRPSSANAVRFVGVFTQHGGGKGLTCRRYQWQKCEPRWAHTRQRRVPSIRTAPQKQSFYRPAGHKCCDGQLEAPKRPNYETPSYNWTCLFHTNAPVKILKFTELYMLSLYRYTSYINNICTPCENN